jgi:ElaB/YqjD/DUF883 family membrane-anchored ribosome-binding protein
MSAKSDVQAASRTWEAVCSDLERLGTELARLTRDGVSLGSDRLVEEIGRMRATSDEILSRARSQTEELSGSAAGYIRSNPLATAIAAFGVGTALALILAKR